MKRVNYHLPERQIQALRKLSEQSGLSVAELIRRAIDNYLIQEGANGPGLPVELSRRRDTEKQEASGVLLHKSGTTL